MVTHTRTSLEKLSWQLFEELALPARGGCCCTASRRPGLRVPALGREARLPETFASQTLSQQFGVLYGRVPWLV